MEQHDRTRDTRQPRISLSQETITIVTVGVALAGLVLMESAAMRAEARADRDRSEAAMREMRAEGRADRAEWRASREDFERRITQLVEQQGTLNGLVDGLRNPVRPTVE